MNFLGRVKIPFLQKFIMLKFCLSLHYRPKILQSRAYKLKLTMLAKVNLVRDQMFFAVSLA